MENENEKDEFIKKLDEVIKKLDEVINLAKENVDRPKQKTSLDSMKEADLYDAIGKWLVKNKIGEQKYSQGYLKDVKINDERVDVLSIKYELLKNRERPALHFHGYMVEVKMNEKEVTSIEGRIKRQILPSLRRNKGMHTVRFYVAYPAEHVSEEIYKMCEEEGIGLLRLEITEDGKIYIYEIPGIKPREIELEGIPNGLQNSPGNFEEAIKSVGYLRKMFPMPDRLYEEFIRPGEKIYEEKIKLRTELDKIQNREGQEALNFFIEKVTTNFPNLKMRSGINLIYNENTLLSIKVQTANFYVELGEESCRVNSKTDIICFKEDRESKFYQNLEEFIENKVFPYIRQHIRDNPRYS